MDIAGKTTSVVASSRLAATNGPVDGQADGRKAGLAALAGRRLRHIWPALRRNLIFNLRTVGHMRLLKRQACGEAAAARGGQLARRQIGWLGGCRLKLLAHVACRQRQRQIQLRRNTRFIYTASNDRVADSDLHLVSKRNQMFCGADDLRSTLDARAVKQRSIQ